MFEKLVTSVINSYFGKYIQNLDSSNLDISLLGNAELTDLQLRPEALAQLDLPIEVKAGYIGHMKIDIPWTNLFSSDVHVYLEDVYILAGPVTDRQYDPQRERQLHNAVKRQKLEALEKSAVEAAVESTEEEPGFYEKLLTNFVNRLQLSIRNIHIRYEDTITNVDHPFACGIMLKQIAIHSTDAKWNPLKGESTSNFMHKLLRLENLSVYWNPYIPEQHLVKTRLNNDSWRNLLRMSIDSRSILQEEFDFIIEPVTAQARIIISTENNSLPKMFADFTLEEIEVLLSRQQFLNLLALNESFQMMRVNQRYRKYHPNVPLKVSPKSWWLYAYIAILEEVIRPFSWERIKEHRAKYKKYKDLYKKSLEKTGNESIRSTLWEMEENLDVANILLAREHAKVQFLHEAPERAKRIKKKKKTGWFGSWFGSSTSDEEEEVEIENPDSYHWLVGLSNDEKQKLYQGIGYDLNANITTIPAEYVKHKVQVILKSCCLSLVNYSKKILQVSVTHMLATWEDRPATGAFRISSNTESFSIEGASIEHELIPILTSDIGVYAPSVNQVFTLDFEVKPLYVDADYSLSLSLQPVEIVYDEHSLSEVSAFFQVPHGSIDMRSAAMETLQGVANYSRAGLQYAIDKHKTVHVAINMRSPYIVVPEFGTLHRGGNVLVADFGTLRVDSELQPKDVNLEDATMSEIESRLYDQFNIKLSEVKVLLADSGDDWHTAQTQPDSEYHILPSVQLFVAFFNAVKIDYKQLPQQKLVASLPTLKLNISDKKMLLLMSFFRNFPIPTSTSVMTLGEDMVDSAVMLPAIALDLNECQLEPDVVGLRKIRRSVLLGRRVAVRVKNKLVPLTSKDVPGLADEVYYSASDHSDEEVDEWSEYLKIKPVDDNMYPSNAVKILIRMTLGEFVINLSKVMDKHETPYLMFRVNRLRIDSSLTVFGYGVHATLGGIQLVDKIHTGSAGEYMEMLGTSSDTDLVSVLYRNVSPECPDFDQGYGSVEHAILLKFSKMSALFDQASMIYLNTFIQGMVTSLHSIDNMKTSTSTVTSELVHKDRPSLTERLTSITDEVDNLPPRCIKMNLVAQLEDLSIRLCDSENSFALINVKKFDGHALVKGTKSTVRCRLKDLSVQDCSVGAIYPKILMIEDENCFDLKFVKFNKSFEGEMDNKQKSHGLDYSIRLRIGQLQMVYLSKFYWELIRFFEPFINSEMTEAARLAAVETMTRQYDDIKSQNIRISLNVDLRAPTVLIPQHSKSTEMFLLNLGDLSIKNYFNFSDLPPDMKQEWNHIYMNLSHVQMNRVSLCLADDMVTILHNVIEPISFKADVRMALKPVVSDVKLDISGHLNKIKLNIVSKDLQLLLAILKENLTEGAPQHTSGIYESPTMQQLIPQISLDAATPISESRHSLGDPGEKSSTSILFRLDGVSAELFEQSPPEEGSLKDSLCHLEIEKLSLNTIIHSDGDIKSNFALQSITIDDSRPDSDLAVKRILYCASKKSMTDELPLMSLIYKISSDGNQKADLMLEKMRLNVHVPYIMVLLKFFQDVFQESKDLEIYTMESSTTSTGLPDSKTLPQTSLNIYGTCKQPEIVLFADHTKIDSRVVVLYADVAFEYRTDPEKQFLWSKVSNLQLVSSINTGCNNSRSQVLSPCSVEMTESFHQESGIMDVSVKLTKMNIYLSAAIVQLLWDVYLMIQLPVQESNPTNKDPKSDENKNLWRVSTVTNSKYLTDRVDHADMKSHLKPSDVYKERLKIEIEELNAMFAVENLDVHVPIICLRTSLQGTIDDWTRKLHIEGEFHMEMFFFNEKLDVWEPLLEPVMDKEGVYRPWEVLIKVVRTKGFPMACNYNDGDLDVPDGLQNEVQNMMHKSRIRSSSSETDSDAAADMTVIRRRSLRKSRLGSERSFGSLSHHSSIQGESDSEPENFIHNITNKLGSIFSSDSSDADVSETEDTDDLFDPSLDKPVFITSRGPVHMSAGTTGVDVPDGAVHGGDDDDDDTPGSCIYLIVDSQDQLKLNVTPQAISVIKDVIEALATPDESDLCIARNRPAFEVINELGVHTTMSLHSDWKIRNDHVKNCTILKAGENNQFVSSGSEDDIEIISEDDCTEKADTPDSRGFVEKVLADAGHTLVSAGAYVFDDDEDYLSGSNMDLHRLRVQVDGFEPLASILHKKACCKLLPLTPKKSDDMDLENNTRYCMVLDIDMWHGSKIIKMFSPLQLKNNLTMSVDVFCKTEDLKKYRPIESLAGTAEFSKLATVEHQELYYLPLFVAFHCKLYIAPSDLNYEPTYNPLWWQDLIQAKEKSKYFTCQSQNEEKKSFNFKVLCKEGSPLNPAQTVPRTIPYHTISLFAPVTLHNYLPYDIQFSLEGTGSSSSLTHGESTPLYTVDLQKSYKLLISISDYLGCDWRGSLEISSDLEEFKAIAMETDIDIENVNKYLSLSIHADQSQALDLYIYSPYWIVNKTELPLQIRGSISDAVFECAPVANPVLFRFKKYKRKKTRLRVYESKWSQSFSLDTVASSGVVVCHEKERQQKYMFMIQSQMSNLKLTKIITMLPFFLIINCSRQKLRYMEENEEADLWFDISIGEYKPFWPTTESFNMYVKYEHSVVMSQHFPIRTPHTTVLRMQHGTAIGVEVTGGTDSPITVTFRDYSGGDAPVRVENLCEDVFIKIHQKNQSQVSLLSANQAVLYTWDEPVAERTLMWNVYGRKKPSFPAFINKDGSGEVRLSVRSLRKNGSMDVTDSVENPDSSPEDESDETDGLLKMLDEKILGKMRTDKMVIYWVSYLDGLQRILLFTQDERIAKTVRKAHVQSVDFPRRRGVFKMNEGEQTTMACFLSLDGLTVSCINAAYEEVALFSLTSSPSMWEVEVNGRWKILTAELAMWLEDQWKNEVVRANLHDQIEADLVKMQMSKPFMGALRRTYHPGMWFQYRHSEHHIAVSAKIQRLQLDNQLQDAYFPTVFCPAPIPSYILKKTGTKPFIELGFMRRVVPENNIDTIRYCKVLVQEFAIRLDKGFILSVYDIFAQLQLQEGESSQLRSDLLIAQRTLQEVAAVMEASTPQKMYFEYFHLSPLKMHVSFSLNGTPHVVNRGPSSFASDIIDFFLNSVGATLTEIKGVELRMAFFQKKGAILSLNQLLAQIQGHYTQQALQQAYVLILGLDVLGNPYGLVKDFTQGLGDFFYEPFLGSIQGSDEFADGLTRGVQSLMGNTVGGAAGSVALVTGSIGNTLATLSFDDDYKRKRRSRMQQQPRNLPTTIVVASRNLVMGVCLGFTGIVLDPLKGAHEEGVEGFFKGIGKGILGLLTKPTGGIVDMISMAFDGIRRAAETESGLIARMRLPRFINPSVGLRSYSAYRAAGLRLLQGIRKGEYSKTDVYWGHAPLTRDERADVMMITNRHLLILEKCRIWGGWDVEWEANIDQILGVPAIVEDKIIFKVKREESSLNLFSGTEQEVHSPEPELLLWIQKQIENLIRNQQQ